MLKTDFIQDYPQIDWNTLTRDEKYAIRSCLQDILAGLFTGEKIYPVNFGGVDCYIEVARVLGIKVRLGNDAPRGGCWGNFLQRIN